MVFKKEDLKKSESVSGYVGNRTVPISDKENVKETIEIRKYRYGGSLLDVEQRYKYTFHSNKEAKVVFDQIQYKINVPLNLSSPQEALLEDKACFVSKPPNKAEINVSCLKSRQFKDEVSAIMTNPAKLQSVLDKAEDYSEDLQKLMKKYLV